MRVLLAHNFYRLPGGEDSYVRTLRALLSEQGHRVGLLAFQSAGMRRLDAAASMVTQRGWPGLVESRATRFRPDVVHLHNPYPGIGLRGVRTLAEFAPVVMTLHNYRLRCPNGLFFTNGAICERCAHGSTLSAVSRNCLDGRLQSLAYAVGLGVERVAGPLERSVTLFISPSRFLADKMTQLGLAADRIRYVPTPHTGRVPSASPAGDSLVFVGRLSREKGVDLLVESARRTGLPTLIAGDGPERATLERRAPENVRFLGWVPEAELATVLGRARLVVLPSRSYENLPLVLIAALAAGRPVIAPEGGSVGRVVLEAGAGPLFSPGSATSLEERLLAAWGQTESLAAWGRAGRAYALREFDPARHTRLLEEAYAEAMDERPRAARVES